MKTRTLWLLAGCALLLILLNKKKTFPNSNAAPIATGMEKIPANSPPITAPGST